MSRLALALSTVLAVATFPKGRGQLGRSRVLLLRFCCTALAVGRLILFALLLLFLCASHLVGDGDCASAEPERSRSGSYR